MRTPIPMIYVTEYASVLGMLQMASKDDELIGLWLEGQKNFAGTLRGKEVRREDDREVFRGAKDWLDRYFAGEKPRVAELSLAPEGTEFQKQIWKILCEIPYGQVTTYGAVAREVMVRMNRKSMSAQAVGGAVGHNPISIIIPCHRVIGADGSLTGYAGGLDKKRKLLEHEGIRINPNRKTAVL